MGGYGQHGRIRALYAGSTLYSICSSLEIGSMKPAALGILAIFVFWHRTRVATAGR
jgi:hypothetical protein